MIFPVSVCKILIILTRVATVNILLLTIEMNVWVVIILDGAVKECDGVIFLEKEC